jgi:hypothetical protein
MRRGVDLNSKQETRNKKPDTHYRFAETNRRNQTPIIDLQRPKKSGNIWRTSAIKE